MKPFTGAYKILGAGALAALLPILGTYVGSTGRYRRHFRERLGFVRGGVGRTLSNPLRIWIHAVSLGEVKVAEAVIQALRGLLPGCSVMVSTFTEHGRNLAVETFGRDVPVFYAPLDTWVTARRALSAVSPRVMVFTETELWPAWISEAQRLGIRTALINGRISARSVGAYVRFRPLFKEVLGSMDVLSMISRDDAERVRMMGARKETIEVNGNAKFDLSGGRADPAIEREMRERLHLGSSSTVFVAGSIRRGEEVMVLDTYDRIRVRHPGVVLILVPRHLKRVPEIRSHVERRRLGYHLRTELDGHGRGRTENVIILDTFGELFKTYSVASLVFCGGSLAPYGGQNPLEPAIWGKVVFYGPHMDNFLWATSVLEDYGAGIQVRGPEDMAEQAIRLLNDPDTLKARGARGPAAVEKNRGAAARHAGVIRQLALMDR